MSLLRLLPVAVASLLVAACVCARKGSPTAAELHELTLEQLLEIPIETVRRVSEQGDARNPTLALFEAGAHCEARGATEEGRSLRPAQGRRSCSEESPRSLATPVLAATTDEQAAPAEAGVGADGVDEYQLKAAFIGKFVKYVTWPPERLGDSAPLVVGVLGQDPFGDKLEAAFKNRKSDERRVVVQRFPTLDGLEGAHVLFVPAQEAARLGDVVRATRDASLLLIGESADFAARGGIINFYLEGDKLRFEINTESAKRQKLKVSSDLLKLARIVSDKG